MKEQSMFILLPKNKHVLPIFHSFFKDLNLTNYEKAERLLPKYMHAEPIFHVLLFNPSSPEGGLYQPP